MLRSFVKTIGLTLLAGAAGCGDSQGLLFADIQYATRCEETLGCAGVEAHDVCGVNGGEPCEGVTGTARISCSVQETDTTRTINFSARQEIEGRERHSITVSRLQVPFDGGSASGGDCRVRIEVGANEYEGLCGASLPSEAQPCQVTDVQFRMDENGNDELEGHIFCQFLENEAQPNLRIEVTAIGSSMRAFGGTPLMPICDTYPASSRPPACTPGRFRIANCPGLRL